MPFSAQPRILLLSAVRGHRPKERLEPQGAAWSVEPPLTLVDSTVLLFMGHLESNILLNRSKTVKIRACYISDKFGILQAFV